MLKTNIILKTTICLILLSASPLMAKKIKFFKWKSDYYSVLKSIPVNTKIKKIKPSANKHYRNRILNFIRNANDNVIKDIDVLKLKINPEIDLIFIRKKLYITSKSWHDINIDVSNKILEKLTSQYGKPVVQKTGRLDIYSFKIEDEKMFLYKKKLSNGNYKCKLYNYTKKLFRILFMD